MKSSGSGFAMSARGADGFRWALFEPLSRRKFLRLLGPPGLNAGHRRVSWH